MNDGAAGIPASGFDLLLARLHDDPREAAAEFERLRRTLLRFFGWRGVAIPEDAADETLDRVARRLGEGHPIADVSDFALGVARLLVRESWRAGSRFEAIDDPDTGRAATLAAAPADTDDGEPEVAGHLERCLGELAPDARTLVLDYYAGSPGKDKIEGRRALAQAHGLTDNALRSRVQRLRDRLEECVRGGLARAAGKGRRT